MKSPLKSVNEHSSLDELHGPLDGACPIRDPLLMCRSRETLDVNWSDRQSMTTGTFEVLLQATFDGKTVQVAITHGAFTLYGVEACKRFAELEIVKAMQDGLLPERVEVSEKDFAK